MESWTDRALWVASCAGDTDAFVALVGRHHRAVSAITLATTGDVALSEDLAQETFLAAWRNLAQVRDPDKIAAWLGTIARNLGRRTLRRSADWGSEPPTAELPSDAATPEEVVAAQQEHLAVWTALSDLPLQYREPLILAYRDGQSSQEIAAVLGLTVAAVAQRLSRGRRLLRIDVVQRLEPALAAVDPQDRVARRVAALIPLFPVAGSPLGTTVGLGLLTMKKLIAFAALLALLASLIAWGLLQHDARVVATTPGSAAGLRTPTPTIASAPPIATRREALRAGARDTDAGAAAVVGVLLELTTHGNVTTVNLQGGPSRAIVYQSSSGEYLRLHKPAPGASAQTMEEFEQAWMSVEDALDEPAPTRVVRGTVASSDGEPVVGAVVLAGAVGFSYPTGEPHAWGNAGTRTDAGGAFRLDVPAHRGASVLAMKGEHRSRVVTVAAGSGSAAVSLRLDAAARLVGETLRDGEGTQAQVRVEHTTTHVTYTVESDLQGRFTLKGIDGGRYTVRAHGESVAEAPKTREVEVEVEVAQSGTTTVQLDLPAGGLLAVGLLLPPSVGNASTLTRLMRGQLSFEDRAALSAVLDEASQAGKPRGLAHTMRTGTREELEEIVEFVDLDPGEYTVCVQLMTVPKPTVTGEGTVNFQTDPLAFQCASTSLAPDMKLAELEIALPG